MLLAFVWFLIALILGASAFFVAGLVAGAVGGPDVRDRIGRWYIKMAQSAYRNTALVVCETGSLALTTVSFDPKFGGDKSTIDGVVGHWEDPLSAKSTLAGKEFGIGLESASCYISPLAAEFGDEGTRRLENGWPGSTQTDVGREQVTLDYSIPENPEVLDLRTAAKFLKGSCKRRWGELSNRWAELSQEGFHDRFSIGQSLLWIVSFAVGVGLGFVVVKYGTGGGDAGGTTLPIMVTLALPVAIPQDAEDLKAALTSTTAKFVYLAAGAVAVAVVGLVVALVVYGPWSAVAIAVGGIIGLSGPYVYVRLLFTPVGKTAFGTAFAILGQLTFGEGALCRREDGTYEWGNLREDDTGLFLRLESGRRVDITADRADLPTVAWAPLAVVEEKTESNMRRFTVDEAEFETTRPDPTGDDGAVVRTPLALTDGGEGWHLDAAKLERWARGSGGAELPRNGRRKALEEKGGEQQISQLVTMVGAAVLAVLGFGMSAGVLSI